MSVIEMILDEIEAEHPYKVPGDHDTYSQYNEGWNDAIDRVRGELKTINKELFEFDFTGVKSFECRCGQKFINTGVEANRWIAVEERLPENNEDVLVTTDVGLITFGYFSHGKWITNQEPDYPIAWRPLPEPYRPEGSV